MPGPHFPTRLHNTPHLITFHLTAALHAAQTNASGMASFVNLTAGYTYSLEAFAANHTSVSTVVSLTGGWLVVWWLGGWWLGSWLVGR